MLSGPPSRLLDGRDNIGVGTATANVAAHALPHGVVVGPARFVEQSGGGHHLSCGAVAALESIVLKESRLYRVKLAVFLEPFNSRDFISLVHDGERQAGIDAAAVHVNCAGAALAVIASFLSAEQRQVFAQSIEQRDPRLQSQAVLAAVDLEGHRDGFGGLRCRWRWCHRALLGVGFGQPWARGCGHARYAPS